MHATHDLGRMVGCLMDVQASVVVTKCMHECNYMYISYSVHQWTHVQG